MIQAGRWMRHFKVNRFRLRQLLRASVFSVTNHATLMSVADSEKLSSSKRLYQGKNT